MADLRTALLHRRNKEYDAALALYREIWNERPDSGIAAAIINCLRGLGRFDEAEEFFGDAVQKCQATPWLKTEHVWTVYAKYIKPVETPDKELFMEMANLIMGLTEDLLPRKLTAFKVSDVLGREPSPDWNSVRQWLESIREVEDEATTVDPGKKMSDKRKWYFKYTKALVKLGEYGVCRHYCRKAQKLFKNSYFFKHRAAKCARLQGDFDQARREYDDLLRSHDEWYVHMDMAELLLTADEPVQAEKHVLTAIGKCENLQLKIRTFFLWAQILARTQPSLAWLPLHFFITYRESRGWPVNEEATELASRYPVPAGEADGDLELEGLETRCEALAHQRNNEYQPVSRGAIKNLQEKFGFIKSDDGADIFFSLSSYRGRMPVVGQRVTFRIKRAFDRRKKRDSLEAYDVAAVER